ncbi:MAG TPA: SDR family NAD(P)-dependent oxidoreductase [Bacteroidia bacterium]|jgi:uncharacterized oxidoreductase|nr:SDR family NAD(P)-dependent oxidoreductase [Bacteroidia bacterium]
MKTTHNTILITGGSSGIGFAFAERFLKLGNKVIITGRRKEKLDEAAKQLPGVIAIVSDVENESEREALVKKVITEFPDVNVLINNAGVQLMTDLSKPVDNSRMRREFETNLFAPIDLATKFAEHFKTQKEAYIINITSGLSFVPIARVAMYCATKAALHSLTLSLRHELRNTSVKVLEVIPPQVDTKLGAEGRGGDAGTHGGMPLNEFLEEAMAGLATDESANGGEIAVGRAKGLREKREQAFGFMNPQ